MKWTLKLITEFDSNRNGSYALWGPVYAHARLTSGSALLRFPLVEI